ncbi:5'-nucleotidase C-terminal domain-containing protein [Pectobacterium sp. FL60-S17]|uniref:5'-nucleotidase C-terminal domain-containing protein n=1 Tax=Pectobacterium quasiaquaticum TaxID=2774015 RepID=A0A9Q2ETF0_9GAMM|nr:5'-nucleotidase C-terminal domain-containing protein [Pectobacterium quasiaquaticum]MBE5201734.1 5'-nucleotidase C-terminal domain-containing protein [Pectobacterium quasiaquaticum]MBE5210049.1 5'-nucleotidase C-terminal domain-containing protein [Pectobacterium quasiaquaticum]MBE5212982.1 5'-nucleotidase C-terminal domain-containing protein [Pectobacterium quasiaquaticum]MBE5222903.1 5'-nucleotidase C-terminal domain-containing protein [Pectobacterium quasiaquaticum]MBE5226958.1 5'-nucleot
MKKTLLSLLLCLSTSAMAAQEPVNITILGTSDLHGTFVPWDYATDTANMAGSLSQIATQVHKVRAQQPNVILVDAGDTIQGNFVETFKNDKNSPMILGFNALNYDVWVLGNHEFDFGLNVLSTSLDQFKGTALAGNIFWESGKPYLPAYKIVERQGVKIGIIGMDTPMTAEFAKGTDRVKGLNFTDPVGAVKTVIQQIHDKVDAIVLVAHMGIDNENQRPGTGVGDIARANPELAAIVAGHMHIKVDKEVINGVIVTEPDRYGRALSRIDLQFEQQNGKYVLINKDSYTYSIKDVDSDRKMEDIYEPYHNTLRANANRPIAQLLGHDLVPQDAVKGIPQVHVQDTGISALFQEASRHYAPKAQVIALQIDNDRPKLNVGTISAKDIAFNYQYAGGEITVYQLTGKELKKYMEWSAGYFNQLQDGDVTYSFNPQRRASKYSTNDFFDGVTYTIDLTKPAGQRITDLKMNNGTPVTDDMPIRLGMNSYRMGHLTQKGGVLEGMQFPVLSDTKAEYGEEAGTIRNLTIRYLTEVKKGQYEGTVPQRWKLAGLQGYERERRIIESLLNSGKISVPTSDDGRYSNVQSINVKSLLLPDAAQKEKRVAELTQQRDSATNALTKQRLNDQLTIIAAIN